jgi:hypothetical protein
MTVAGASVMDEPILDIIAMAHGKLHKNPESGYNSIAARRRGDSHAA